MAGCVDPLPGALAIATTEAIAIAIMQIELASLPDGVETARRLRDEYGVRCLFVSADIQASARAAASAFDPVGFIDEPLVALQI